MSQDSEMIESQFIHELTNKLNQSNGLVVKENPGTFDMVVSNPSSGKNVIVEFKAGGQYGELPISAILSVAKMLPTNVNDSVILVSFSGISKLLFNKLNELNIKAFAKPSVDEVLEQVQLAVAS